MQEKQEAEVRLWYESNDPDVDPVGACVGMNGARVNAIAGAVVEARSTSLICATTRQF